MAKYLLIESRDPFEYGDVGYFYDTAKQLSDAGNDVTFYLIQNGAFMARKGVEKGPLDSLVGSKIKVVAEDFSLKERGITSSGLAPGVKVSNINELVDLLLEDGVKAVWH